MNVIKINNTEFGVINYNKVTYFGGETISSSASCTITVEDIADLNALAEVPITSIQIYHDEELIYNLQNITARFDNINEWLNEDHMDISVNIIFSNV